MRSKRPFWDLDFCLGKSSIKALSISQPQNKSTSPLHPSWGLVQNEAGAPGTVPVTDQASTDSDSFSGFTGAGLRATAVYGLVQAEQLRFAQACGQTLWALGSTWGQSHRSCWHKVQYNRRKEQISCRIRKICTQKPRLQTIKKVC